MNMVVKSYRFRYLVYIDEVGKLFLTKKGKDIEITDEKFIKELNKIRALAEL